MTVTRWSLVYTYIRAHMMAASRPARAKKTTYNPDFVYSEQTLNISSPPPLGIGEGRESPWTESNEWLKIQSAFTTVMMKVGRKTKMDNRLRDTVMANSTQHALKSRKKKAYNITVKDKKDWIWSSISCQGKHSKMRHFLAIIPSSLSKHRGTLPLIILSHWAGQAQIAAKITCLQMGLS